MELVSYHNNPRHFLDEVEDYLITKEAMHNLPLGIVHRLVNHLPSYPNAPFLFALKQGDETVGVVMRTPPHHWIVSFEEKTREHAIKTVTNTFLQQNLDVPGIVGGQKDVLELAEVWGEPYEVEMDQWIYQITKVTPIPKAPGKLRPVEKPYANLLARWLWQYGQEVQEPMEMERAITMADRFVKEKSAYLWEVNGKPVSMANSSRATKNGASINAVFTPDEYKRKGFATSCVAELTQKLLDQGKTFCTLYTDAANPISNSIYQKIGYQKIGDSVKVKFK
ncbi:GNAT family N-acetyltransferase [Bacillaceae bacterium S4-13-58]